MKGTRIVQVGRDYRAISGRSMKASSCPRSDREIEYAVWRIVSFFGTRMARSIPGKLEFQGREVIDKLTERLQVVDEILKHIHQIRADVVEGDGII